MDTFQPNTVQLGGDFEGNFRQQVSSVVDMLIARKMRVNVSETSRLAVQSVGGSPQAVTGASPGVPQPSVSGQHSSTPFVRTSEDSSSSPASAQQRHLSRRYSKPQAEDEGDVTTDMSAQILSRFSQTVTLSTGALLRRGSLHRNLYEKSLAQQQGETIHESEELTTRLAVPAHAHSLTRHQSTPDLQAMTPPAIAAGSGSSSGGLISRYLRRRGSMDAILPSATRDQTDSALDPTSSSTLDSSSSSALSQYSPSGKSIRDTPLLEDPSSPTVAEPQSSGFGILSRTRQFGAWLTKATDGEKVEVSHKDLNTIVPNTF